MIRGSKLSAALLIILVITLSVTGCGNSGNSTNENDIIKIPEAERPLADNTGGISEIHVIINGQNVEFTEQTGRPFIDSANHTLAPFVLTMESFGAAVSWEDETDTAVAEKDGIKVEAPIGSNYINVDGVQVQNDSTAVIINDVVYLPIRAVLEAFGAEVSWDQDSNAVIVLTSGDQLMTLSFIDVGQADAILIDFAEYEILIDGGNRRDGKPVSEYIRPYVDGPIELIIATHPDADHIGGLIDVINTFDVSEILYNGEQKDTQTYKDFESAAKTKQNCELKVAEDTTIDMGGSASIQIIAPVTTYKDTNENSIVSLLEYGEVSVLLTGDMETKAEKDLMNRFSNVDVLKAAHHGSKTSSSAQFLNIIQPDYVVISAGMNNTYKHPHFDALKRYFDIGATVYGTFKDGTIIMNTDGKTYSFNAQTEVTLDDAGD